MATLTLSGIHKRYANGAHAVRGVDMEISDGELIVFVGPSGCGKSTLLRMVAGLETVTEGEIAIDGRLINQVSPADRDVAMVFQNYALYPHMSVFGNMSYGLKNRGLAKNEIKTRVREVARMLRIEEHLDRRPNQLSGGQRQRVAMGRAIVRNPNLSTKRRAAHWLLLGYSTFWVPVGLCEAHNVRVFGLSDEGTGALVGALVVVLGASIFSRKCVRKLQCFATAGRSDGS